ncbi:MAG: metalloregulator ArsR/SmtB family transcription factor [Anaerolineales bacterium]
MDSELVEAAISQAELCALFGYSKRILILWALAYREMTVGEIAQAIETSIQSTSHHLRLMRDRGVVWSEREGAFVRYRLVEDHSVGCLLMNIKNHPTLARSDVDPFKA